MPTQRGLNEVKSDCFKTFGRLQACFSGFIEQDSDVWRTVMVLCDSLGEEASRAFAISKQLETLAKVREMHPGGLPEST